MDKVDAVQGAAAGLRPKHETRATHREAGPPRSGGPGRSPSQLGAGPSRSVDHAAEAGDPAVHDSLRVLHGTIEQLARVLVRPSGVGGHVVHLGYSADANMRS